MNLLFKKEQTPLEKEIDRILKIMNRKATWESSDYSDMAGALEKLARANKEYKSSSPLDWNTVITAGTSLLGLLLMLNFERLGIITSRGMSWIKRP